MRAFGLELRKLKRKRLWITVGAVLLFELGWVMAALLRTFAQHGEEAKATGYVLGEAIQLHGLFAPILVAVIASRLSAMEYEADMFKQLFAVNQSRQSLFGAKFATAFAVVMLYTAVGATLLTVFGAVNGVRPEWGLAGTFLIGLTFAGIAPISIHLLLALVTERQVVTLGVGIVGGIAGTFVGFVPTGVSLALPWHYFGVVNPVRMESEGGSIVGFSQAPGTWAFMAVVAAVGATLYFAAQWVYQRTARD